MSAANMVEISNLCIRYGKREVLKGAAAHTAAATFSHVIGVGPYLFLAGQIPIDASAVEIVQ